VNLLIRMFLVALVLVAPCWAASAEAQYGCYRPTYYNNYPAVVKNETYYQKDVLVATFVPLVVTVPTYSATYVPGYAPAIVTPAAPVAQGLAQTAAPQGFDVNALAQALTRINERLTTIETSIQGGVSAQGQGNDFQMAFAQNCGACHGTNPKGNKFGFVTGPSTMRQLTDREAGKALSRILRDPKDPQVMPPAGHDLKPETRSLLASALTAMLDGPSQGGGGQPTNGNPPAQMSVPQMNNGQPLK